jgi:hypothetical protein
MMVAGEKMKQVVRDFRKSTGRLIEKAELSALKKDIFDEVVVKVIPEDIITRVGAYIPTREAFSSPFYAVHDTHYGWAERALAHAEAVRFADCCNRFRNLRILYD